MEEEAYKSVAVVQRGSKSEKQKRVPTNKTERVALAAPVLPVKNSPGKKKGLKMCSSVASTAPSSMGRTQSKWIT